MKDRKGNELAVGDRVYVLPDEPSRTGGSGWLRRFSENGSRARVDDGQREQASLEDDDSWTWGAWVTTEEVEKL